MIQRMLRDKHFRSTERPAFPKRSCNQHNRETNRRPWPCQHNCLVIALCHQKNGQAHQHGIAHVKRCYTGIEQWIATKTTAILNAMHNIGISVGNRKYRNRRYGQRAAQLRFVVGNQQQTEREFKEYDNGSEKREVGQSVAFYNRFERGYITGFRVS